METIEIRSAHSLLTRLTEQRPAGQHSYQVNCRQFTSEYKNWRKNKPDQWPVLRVMTLGFEQIFFTEAESQKVADAIQAVQASIEVG